MRDYDDIIHLPHHRSKKRSPMSMLDRAAQFSPFAALTGFDAAIEETGRQTDYRPELLDYENAQLDHMLASLQELLPKQPQISITFFLPDSKKSGGCFESVSGQVRKIDLYNKRLIMTDGKQIPLTDILHMESSEIPEFF